MILGILLSTLHQSSLGSLYLIIPTKMHPLWYSPLLPVFFYISAIGTGLMMVVFEAYMSARAFGHGLKLELLSKVAVVTLVMLVLNLVLKVADLAVSNELNYLFIPSNETYLYYLEILVGTVIPIVLLSSRNYRQSRFWLYITSLFVISGFLLNRVNVSVTSLTTEAGYSYFPSVYEISITMMLVVIGMWAFKFIVRNFPVFEEETKEEVSLPIQSREIILSE